VLDFTKLRGGPDGWRGSFERLIQHLAETAPPSGAVEFRPIHGSGGDGGIEAYWVLSDDSETGYQAKFHPLGSEIDWSALDRSVETALATHPRLTHLVVAMPRDLTDVTARRGKSAREKWDERRGRWIENARPRQVDFSFLGESQIERLLTAPAAAGIREYWFGEAELSDDWFRRQFTRTAAALEERYHPGDHVEVFAGHLFDALRGQAAWRADYARLAAEAVAALPPPGEPGSSFHGEFHALNTALAELTTLSAVTEGPTETFPTARWRAAVDNAIDHSRAAMHRLDSEEDGYRIRRLREAIGLVENPLSLLSARLATEFQVADDGRYAIVEGETGGGKSHIMAASVEAAILAGEPAIMLLGTDFAGTGEPGEQIARRFELTGMATATLLGALDAAAAARGTRALIAIDALNEGAGGGYWRSRLAAFAADVRRYPRLALCVSCRDVYSRRVISDRARQGAAQIVVEGFTAPEEQERAAVVYLDQRGIARPPSPWLPPEFINPLFLRTTCVALEKKGERQFPRGLRGTRQMMRFYLEAAAQTLGTEYDGTDELLAPLLAGVRALAAEMASARADFVSRQVAVRLLETAFAGYAAPAGQTWVDVLRLAGMLRDDPADPIDYDYAPTGNEDPLAGPNEDPLTEPEDVLRFAFQRIQDHLIAKSLIAHAAGPAGLFDEGGPLAFIIGRWGLHGDWLGVFGALAIEFADEWRAEIADHLPGGFADWWPNGEVQEAFIESVRWRQVGSFTERSHELLEAIDWPLTSIDLLVELSAVEGHPWNADRLHGDLVALSMPERDARWTLAINGNVDARGSGGRLVQWGQGPGPQSASDETVRLALLALGWLCTSTNWALRDGATKSATEILLRRPASATDFVAAFAAVNDIYVWERVLAAVAASCLRDPRAERVRIAAASVWEWVFARRPVPPHPLLRDYARLIIELAHERGVLPAGCDIAACRPPYDARALRFGLDEARVKAQSEAAGDYSIFSSVVGFGGDFGNYIVKGRVREFSAVRLARRPMRHGDAFAQFKAEFTDGDGDLSNLVDIIEMTSGLQDSAETCAWAEAHLLDRLSARGKARFATDARPHLDGAKGWRGYADGKLPRIDDKQARLWIARRALQLGWHRDRFPHDSGAGDGTVRARRIERIGKKYQWIAYFELLARLADNVWLMAEDPETGVKAYDTPLDLPFLRNLDPTVPAYAKDDGVNGPSTLLSVPRLTIGDVPVEAMESWTFDSRFPRERLGLALCPDVAGAQDEWVSLYRYTSISTQYAPVPDRIGAPFRLDDFHFVMMIGLKPRDREGFVRRASGKAIDFHDWMTWGDLTDGPYLYEAGLRPTWPDDQWIVSDDFRSIEQEYLRLCREYRWEYHLDGTLANGFSLPAPSAWLLRELGLVGHPTAPGVFVDAAGEPVIVASAGERNSFCIARRRVIEAALDRHGAIPMWVGLGERTAWPDAAENAGPRRRWNGILWGEDGALRQTLWAEDHEPAHAFRNKTVLLTPRDGEAADTGADRASRV